MYILFQYEVTTIYTINCNENQLDHSQNHLLPALVSTWISYKFSVHWSSSESDESGHFIFADLNKSGKLDKYEDNRRPWRIVFKIW
jgi:ERCC4-type nuclease